MNAATWMSGSDVLRVGLTGGLGSGKSTVLRMFAECGAKILQSDAIGRELMQPGQDVYMAILEKFGREVVLSNGQLDRAALARLAFKGGRVEELNGIVHPAVIARQEMLLSGMLADSVVVIESALIFETQHGGQAGWRERFDRLVLVIATETTKVARFLERSGATPETAAALASEARRRLAAQIPDEEKISFCDFILDNNGDISALQAQVQRIWQALQGESHGQLDYNRV